MYKLLVLSFFKKNWIMKLLMGIMLTVIWISELEQFLKLSLTIFLPPQRIKSQEKAINKGF